MDFTPKKKKNPVLGSKTKYNLILRPKDRKHFSMLPIVLWTAEEAKMKFASNSDITLPKTFYFLTYVSNVSAMRQ